MIRCGVRWICGRGFASAAPVERAPTIANGVSVNVRAAVNRGNAVADGLRLTPEPPSPSRGPWRSREVIHGLLALLTAIAPSSSCQGGPAEPENPTVTGNWTGTGVSFGTAESWRFRLEESSDGTVTGTFSIRVERLVFSGTVDGTHAYPAVSLDLDLVFFGQIVSGAYQGRVISPASIEGQVHLIEDLARTLDLSRLDS